MMCGGSNSFRVVGIAGQISSGKTTVAAEVCKRVNGGLVSFGDVVRNEAMRRGIENERASLQRLVISR